MMYYNNGTFETENEETMKELLRIIDEVGLGTATCSESDLYRLTNFVWNLPTALVISRFP